MEIVLDSRMKKIADCVRCGGVLADIGTDHGKLPIYLAQKGIVKRAVASDINSMPLQRADNNIKKYGMQDRIDTFLTDGLRGVEDFGPTDVVIAGMGGELIEQILSASEKIARCVKLILQPMTKEETLRKYLCENGYSITEEYIVRSGKLYQIICAEYTGKITDMTQVELVLGKVNLAKKEELLADLAEREIRKIEKVLAGKEKAGIDSDNERKLLKDLLKVREDCYGNGKSAV